MEFYCHACDKHHLLNPTLPSLTAARLINPPSFRTRPAAQQPLFANLHKRHRILSKRSSDPIQVLHSRTRKAEASVAHTFGMLPLLILMLIPLCTADRANWFPPTTTANPPPVFTSIPCKQNRVLVEADSSIGTAHSRHAFKRYPRRLSKIQPNNTQYLDHRSVCHFRHTLSRLSQTDARRLCNHPSPRPHRLADHVPGPPSTINDMGSAVVPHSRLTPLVSLRSQPRP